MTLGVDRFADDIEIMAVRLIVDALALFVFHDLLFAVDDILVHRIDKPAQLIGFGPDDLFQRVLWYGLEILRHIGRGEAIRAFAANPRIHLVQTAIAEVFRVQEQEMLEQMRKARLTRKLPT